MYLVILFLFILSNNDVHLSLFVSSDCQMPQTAPEKQEILILQFNCFRISFSLAPNIISLY